MWGKLSQHTPLPFPTSPDWISDVITWWQKLPWYHEGKIKKKKKIQGNDAEPSSSNQDPLNPCHQQPSPAVRIQWGGQGQFLTGLRISLRLLLSAAICIPIQLTFKVINLVPTTIYFIICLKFGFPSRWKESYSCSYNISHQAGGQKMLKWMNEVTVMAIMVSPVFL